MGKTKTKKFRGHRTAGGGTHKNRRGGGSHGGRGNAGSWKHHAMRSRMRGEIKGKHGFVMHNARQLEVFNVDELDGLGIEEIDLPQTKVLGRGRLNRKLIVRACSFSDTAKSKIEAAGGEAVII